MGVPSTLNATFLFRVYLQPRLNHIEKNTDGLPLKAGKAEQLLAVFSKWSAKFRKKLKSNILILYNEPELRMGLLEGRCFRAGSAAYNFMRAKSEASGYKRGVNPPQERYARR
jgi:hypothetical protein